MDDEKDKFESEPSLSYTTGVFLITTLATYGLMRKGNYRIALEFYPKTGGGGLNFYKPISGKSRRFFGIDYHPFWNHKTQQNEWGFHYHRGTTKEEIKKHRPYDAL